MNASQPDETPWAAAHMFESFSTARVRPSRPSPQSGAATSRCGSMCSSASPSRNAISSTGSTRLRLTSTTPSRTVVRVYRMVEELRGHFEASGVAGELEIHPGVHHGFAFPERWCYDKPAAERHWERLIALYRRRLG